MGGIIEYYFGVGYYISGEHWQTRVSKLYHLFDFIQYKVVYL